MGMRDERKEQAASMEARAKRMYEETANPYYIVEAIAVARWGDFPPGKWALDVLLNAVDTAWFKYKAFDTDVSIDASLGLRKSRGKKSNERSANKATIESAVFDLVKIIHTCFDVSIPKACELVYSAIDNDFARGAEETLCRPRKEISPEILTDEEIDTIEKRWDESSRRIIASPVHTATVRTKLEAGDWWTVTHGDRLGYSLDQLMDRYYRVGSKRTVPHGNISEHEWLLFQGQFLLLIRERCTHAIDPTSSPSCVSVLAGLSKHKDFEQLEKKLATVRKSNISAQ